MKKKLSTILLLLIMLVGAGILLYPTLSDYWNSFHQSHIISNYVESLADMDDEEYEALWTAAADYNRTLPDKPVQFYVPDEERALYESLLDATGTGVMGYIEISKIGCDLPVYHGTSEETLQVAVGHLEGSSLPVGGLGTHCVLTGHRGLPSAKLFTNLDQLEVGDVFVLQILNETLTYEVDQINIVLPGEMDGLEIDPAQDYCTLVTCTPYAVTTHRLLVRGHRIANIAAASMVRVPSEAVRVDPILVASVSAVPMLLVLLLWIFISPGGKKAPKKANDKEESTPPPDGN